MNEKLSVFAVTAAVYSAVFAVLMLMNTVKLAEMSERAADLERLIRETESENELLYLEQTMSMSLSELEDKAVNTLGMQQCLPEQLVYLDYLDN